MNDNRHTAGGVQHAHPLLRRLTRYPGLTESDITSLLDVQRARTRLDAGQDLLRRGQAAPATYFVLSGWLMMHTLLSDGRRQVFSLAMPGDIIGEFSPYRWPQSYNVSALTDAELAVVEPMSFLGLKQRSLALAHALGSNQARDVAILGDQIVRLGRLTAFERHCHLMLELWYRCQAIGDVDAHGSIPFPLKQSDLADILGLSLVHVNRTIMQMKRDNLITLERRRLTIHDVDKMSQIAGYDLSVVLPRVA